jgi:hypothetical protein
VRGGEMNDLVEKIKSLFSKEGEGNKKIMFIVLFLIAFFAYNIFNSFKSKDQGNVSNVNSTEEVSNINSTNNEVLKEKAEETKKKDLEKSGIAFKDEKPEENKQDQADKQSQQNQQQVQQPDNLNSSLNDPLLVKQQQDDKELKKMQLEMQKKQLEMQEQMIKVSMDNQMKAWALDQIGKSVSYGSDDKGKDTTNSNVGINNQLEMQGQASAEVYDLEGTIMDDLRMPVGGKRIARINTEKGIILIGATATPTGIVFDNNATMIKNGKKIPVYVQITDKNGNTNLLTYVINKRNEVVSKVAFLSFLQGFSEGMVKSQITTSVGALGPVNSNIVEGGLRTGLARGASSGVNAYVQEENRNLNNLVNTIVLLKGEKVKIIVVEGGI